jgi:lysine 6-dehydrogenase
MKVLVLGGGFVGSAIARDLAADVHTTVRVADSSATALARCAAFGIATEQADLRDESVLRMLVREATVVIGAVPGFMGFETLRTVIDEGRNVCDISFFPEDPFDLDDLARERGVTAIVDCGLAPGLGNVLLGRLASSLDVIDEFACYVGGLPIVRRQPFEYGAVFSPIDVIEEYTRPARFVEHGLPVIRPALSDVELLDLPGIGTVEAFNTDGLRTLMRTHPVPSMKEKTLRYPGHAALMRTLRDTGFFSQEEIDVRGVRLRPLDLTTALLFPAWKLPDGEGDLSVMHVEITGRCAQRRERHVFDMLDRYDDATATTSMARTTGYTCAAGARLLMGGFSRPGICPPEYIGADASASAALFRDLEQRNIRFAGRIETLD